MPSDFCRSKRDKALDTHASFRVPRPLLPHPARYVAGTGQTLGPEGAHVRTLGHECPFARRTTNAHTHRILRVTLRAPSSPAEYFTWGLARWQGAQGEGGRPWTVGVCSSDTQAWKGPYLVAGCGCLPHLDLEQGREVIGKGEGRGPAPSPPQLHGDPQLFPLLKAKPAPSPGLTLSRQ